MTSPRCAVTVLSALLLASVASAQTTTATVSGTVTDSTDARVVGASVTALSVATGVTTTSTTNEAGVYVFPSLAPGQYTFTAERAGFRRAVISDVILEVGAQLTVNLSLQIGQTSETVEVQATTSEVTSASATVADVINGRKLIDLPLVGRSSYDFIDTQVGTVLGSYGYNFNGNRTGAINFTQDGINSQDNGVNGMFTTGYNNVESTDRAEEVRVVTSPSDVEYGHGTGQVQMITRGGSNAFHGAVYEELRNTDLNANDFFNNLNGIPRTALIRNQAGVRLGGPVKRNRTFFNGLWEKSFSRQTVNHTETVYTQDARNGFFRYYPGVLNGNATAGVPTVDLNGNPVQPARATGPLQRVSVLGLDPNRLVADPSGIIAKQLGFMPLPNNFRVGDGLNTAGFTWNYPVPVNFQIYEGRVDHLFNENERVSLVLNHQNYDSFNVADPPAYPQSPGNDDPTETMQASLALTSILRPNLLNELRVGVYRIRTLVVPAYDTAANAYESTGSPGGAGVLAKTAGGQPYNLQFAGGGGVVVTGGGINPVLLPLDGSNRATPVYQYGDTLSWIKGRHSFKGGVELRYISNEGYTSTNQMPRAYIGAGAVPVQNIATIPNIGSNAVLAQNMLLDLTGSLGSPTFGAANQAYVSPGGTNPTFIPGETNFYDYIQNEYGGFFKDDFKVTPSFTLNVGVRYDWYGVPYEREGRGLAPVGGQAGLFGISGTDFSSLFQPGLMNGSLTQIQLIGPHTPHPGTMFYNNNNKNFSPGVGFAWSLPWFGKNKTVIRAGFGMGYERNPLALETTDSSGQAGLSSLAVLNSPSLLNVGNLSLPIPTSAVPLSTVPLNGARNQSVYAYQTNMRTPYYQNFNFTIQRALSATSSVSFAYVGSNGHQLLRSVETNEVDILNNGFVQAFQTIQAGGDSPLFDSMFGANGVGSNLMRTNATYRTFFANSNPGGLAALIEGSTLTGGVGGKLLAGAGLPPNFFVANPQFLNAYLTGNFGNSTYNSFQVEYNKSFSHGLALQGSYVLSKALGDGNEADSSTFIADFRTLRNASLDKTPLSFDRTHILRANGLYELPFGPGKLIGGNSRGVLGKLIGGWQIGFLFNRLSGHPLSFIAQNTFNSILQPATGALATFTPNILGVLPGGGVTRVGNGVTYFPNLTQIIDPAVANLTTSGNLQALSTLRAIATSNGTPLLVNPLPGHLGNLGLGDLRGPGLIRIDMNLIKDIKITERVTFRLEATAQNLTNTETFGNPDMNINDLTFGRIISTQIGSVTGTPLAVPRIIVIQTRVFF
ncbi:MAG TPA: TonB-dependent receptor [Bryobacteraceae bacterium]|nr:TonB-dependent receptor [Bryobacteraceae bacterium]